MVRFRTYALDLVWIFVVVVSSWLRRSPIGADAASFYGDSYVSVAFQEAKSTTDVQFRFKTHLTEAILLLAAGSTDYCLIVLESGGIKVRINLGAGEAELTSPPGLRLNDLLWHDISLQRTDAEMQLLVDTIHRTRLSIPGHFYELNIHFGVFVGGLGDFNELFLGNMENFRGCFDNFTFNGMNVFKQARENPDFRGIHAVTWDCSDEFDATSERSYSFTTNGAFLALPTMSARNGGSFSLDLKTQGNTSVVLYNGGLPSKSDYIALEMMNGRPKLSVDKGNGVVELKSDVPINDGLWHHIEARFSPSYLELTTDDHITNLRPSLGENRHFDLAGKLYVGGIELNKQARALAHGLESMIRSDTHDGSFKGCIQNVHINGQLVGLREAEITHGIQVDCIWDYPCLRDPCINSAICLQQGIDGFRCLCDQPICMKTDITTAYKLYPKSNQPGVLEILTLHPLHVKEGTSELITSSNIGVVLDLSKFGIRESGVLFHILHLPKFGKLEIELKRRPDENIFTLLDLNTDKVRYFHDGSENHQDTIMMEVEFITRKENMPEYLLQRHRFILSIIVTPVNDPPELKLLSGRVLRLAQNTKKLLTNDILNAFDEDNHPEDLVYTVLPIGNEKTGYIENSRNPGIAVESFTQSDVNQGFISYVHRGQLNNRIGFSVSDGIETGQTAFLRIAAFELQLYMVNNTGLIVTYHSFSYIYPENLTFATNANEQDLEIRYDIVQLPMYGNIQRLRNNGHWQTISHFTQRQMVKDKLRYLHTSGRPGFDEFKFTASCSDLITSPTYDFRITFQAITLKIIYKEELLLDNKQERVIGPDILKVDTIPYSTPATDIIYNIISFPIYGQLTRSPSKKNVPENVYRNFTQEDINRGNVYYSMKRKSYSVFRDHFTFQIFTPYDQSDIMQFNIRYLPGETDALITIERLEVEEGGKRIITKKDVLIETPSIKEFIFNITEPPMHGELKLVNPVGKEETASSFTSLDIESERLLYVHDDSENDHDNFSFLIIPANDLNNFQYIGTQQVKIIMKNDNPPQRIVDKVFQVVTNGERILTGNDLRYYDPDINTKPNEILYTRRGIPNGVLLHADNPDVQIFQFNQQDLDDKKIIFKHSGSSYGRTVLWVSDGQFYTTGILEIKASDPFIVFANNTGLIVQRGKRVAVSPNAFTIDTNINAAAKDVVYSVISSPKDGKVSVNGVISDRFTQWEIENEKVFYENTNPNAYLDFFLLLCQIGQTKAEAKIDVKIYPESYWEPLVIANNRTLVFDEGQIGNIDQSFLQIRHPNVDPRDIIFVVHKPPERGRLEIHNTYSGSLNGSSETNLGYRQVILANLFDQGTINERKLKYIQTQFNVSDDYFEFDVTNGVVQITDLIFRIHIISKVILLETHNLSVEEGGKTILKPEHIIIKSRYAINEIGEYEIRIPPIHGHIQNSLKPGTILTTFTPATLQDGQVQYVHDGSETLFDNFTIVASIPNKGRKSLPTPVFIFVQPINDEFPKIVNNTGLEVWEGSTTAITNSQLAATDEDSQPSELTFLISNLRNGYLKFRNHNLSPIMNFTQDAINHRQVIFIHTGSVASSTGGFYFQVTDGINIGSRQAFEISAKAISLNLIVNEKLYVFPKVRQTITSDNLMAVTSDRDPTREIVFRLKRKPSLGKLLVEDESGAVTEKSYFSQKEVNSSLVAYEHTKSFSDLAAVDSFTFDLECMFAPPLQNQEFNIEISLLKINSEGLDRYISSVPAVVQEGERVTLTKKNFNTSGMAEVLSQSDNVNFVPKIHMVVQEMPEHGLLFINDDNMTIGTKFTQEDIDNNNILYSHDHSDTLNDSTVFTIYLDSTDIGGTSVILLNSTLNFTILPINDQNFELLTKSPSIEVVQGQIAQISTQSLQTVDLDTVPKDIRYDVIQSPKTGRIVLSPNFETPIHFFTQQDIDGGNLFYVHEGSDNTADFRFKVSDGEHKPAYNIFNIYVVPLYLKMSNQSTIILPQGSTAVYLKSSNLGADTNGNRSEIWYNITQPPAHGILLMNDEIVSLFQQLNIDNEQVLYLQTDMAVSEDSFTALLQNEDIVLDNQEFKVLVTPLIEQREYHVPFGTKAVITLDFLNATQLAQQSRSNPLFTVIQKPKYGTLRHMHRKTKPRRSVTENEVDQFTHHSITNQEVYYEILTHSDDYHNDSFEYILTASYVQPAVGRFDFILHPSGALIPDLVTVDDVLAKEAVLHEQNEKTGIVISTTEKLPEIVVSSSADASGNNTSIYSPHISNDHLLIIGIALGVVVLSIVIIISVKCNTKKRSQQQDKKNATTKNGRPLGLHNGRQECDQRPDILEQQSHASDYLTDEVPSISSRSGPTSPKLRPALGGLCHEITPLRATPSPSHDEDWMEISSIVPACKVTALGPNDSLEVNETTLKYPYGMLEPPEIDDWGMYDHSEMRFQRPLNPMLRKNQYWV